MHRTSIYGDGEAQGSCGTNFPAVSRSAAGEPEIIQFPFQAVTAALVGLDAAEPDDCFESVGSVAVRLCGQWSLPRIHVVMAATGREEP